MRDKTLNHPQYVFIAQQSLTDAKQELQKSILCTKSGFSNSRLCARPINLRVKQENLKLGPSSQFKCCGTTVVGTEKPLQ